MARSRENATRMGILKDTSLCVACYACRVACQNHNGLSAEQTNITLKFREKGTYPNVEYHLARKSCMHCANAPCVSACPTRALHVNAQGFVNYVNDTNDACIGCRACITVCPFDVPKISNGKMYKCTGCESLVASGQEPACVDTCIANALQYGTVDELVVKAHQRLDKIRTKYPNANLYSVTVQGGLGTLLILRINADEFPLT